MQTTCTGFAKNDGMDISDARVEYKLWGVFRRIIWKDHTVQYNDESSFPCIYLINSAHQIMEHHIV